MSGLHDLWQCLMSYCGDSVTFFLSLRGSKGSQADAGGELKGLRHAMERLGAGQVGPESVLAAAARFLESYGKQAPHHAHAAAQESALGHTLALTSALVKFHRGCQKLLGRPALPAHRPSRVKVFNGTALEPLAAAPEREHDLAPRSLVQILSSVLRRKFNSPLAAEVLAAQRLVYAQLGPTAQVEEFLPLVASETVETVLQMRTSDAVRREALLLVFHLVQNEALLKRMLPSTNEEASMAMLELLAQLLELLELPVARGPGPGAGPAPEVLRCRIVLRIFARAVETCKGSGLPLVDLLGAAADGSLGLPSKLVRLVDAVTEHFGDPATLGRPDVACDQGHALAVLLEALNFLHELLAHPRCAALALADLTGTSAHTRQALWTMENVLSGPLQAVGAITLDGGLACPCAPGWGVGAGNEHLTVGVISAKALDVKGTLLQGLACPPRLQDLA